LNLTKRKAGRIKFSRGIAATIHDLEGEVVCRCQLLDISSTGAMLEIQQPIPSSISREFFISLSSNGSVLRRCKQSWFDGHRIGVTFVRELNLSRPNSTKQAQASSLFLLDV
jgi:hypothetical protein